MSESESNDCIFCAILAGSTPADAVVQTDVALFIRDISPRAPVHIVGIYKKHTESLATFAAEEAESLGHFFLQANEVAQKTDIAESGYRVVSNIGPDGGQEVPHFHIHILGGERLGPVRC